MIAGWIPPEFRKVVYADSLDADDLEAIRLTTCIYTHDENGNLVKRPLNGEEVAEIRRVKGVIDTRDGSYHPNKFFKD